LAASGSVTIDESDYAYTYTYDPVTNNGDGRKLAGFSTAAEERMSEYTDFKYFKAYYITE